MNRAMVSYLRVSTRRQGVSGLGLDSQRASVESYLKNTGGKLLKEFTEVESGRKNDRQQLKAALDYCKKNNAKLVIARLDRLSRNCHFLTGLMEAKVDFVACDLPEACPFTLKILSVVAEREAELISERVRLALGEAKKRGVKLGHIPNLQKGNKQRAEKAKKFAEKMVNVVTSFKNRGLSNSGVARELNSLNIKTFEGCNWTAVQVSRILKRTSL